MAGLALAAYFSCSPEPEQTVTTSSAQVTLLEDLKRVARGELAAKDFFDRHGASQGWVWAGLPHYFADADIRAKDAAYRAMQDGELARLIRLVEEGATEARLMEITFLGRRGG